MITYFNDDKLIVVLSRLRQVGAIEACSVAPWHAAMQAVKHARHTYTVRLLLIGLYLAGALAATARRDECTDARHPIIILPGKPHAEEI
jgi:hypothetical protein